MQVRCKNTEEDWEEARKKQGMLQEFERKYREDSERLRGEIEDLEGKKDRKKELLEEMHAKLKNEIERVTKDLKINQREVDRLEYEGEENEKDLKSSKEQIGKEVAERDKLGEEQEELRRLVEDYTRLKGDKRDRMKVLQAEQVRATASIKEKLEMKGRVERTREGNLQEVRKLDGRIQKLNIEASDLKQKVQTLERENTWISNEKHMFGNPESVEYRFEGGFNMSEKTRQFYKLKEDTQNLKKHVNMRVDQMSD